MPIFLIGLFVCIPLAFRICPITRPDRREPLRTSGIYGVTRNPLALEEMVWPFGWCVMWKSITGILLGVLHAFCIYVVEMAEEERMEEEYGEEYREYKARVPGFIPCLKIRKQNQV